MHLPLFKIMNEIFMDMIDVIVIIYLDDILNLFRQYFRAQLHVQEYSADSRLMTFCLCRQCSSMSIPANTRIYAVPKASPWPLQSPDNP